MRCIILFIFSTVLLTTACDDDSERSSVTPPPVFDIFGTLRWDGLTRDFLLHLPPDYYENEERRPVLLAFHGGTGSPSAFRENTQLNVTADAEDFVVVYPGGHAPTGTRTWNAGRCCGPNAENNLDTDDVGFVSALIDTLIANYRVDPSRVYATGMSNGAMLCYRLLCELPEKIAAFAPNAGVDMYDLDCPGYVPRPLLHIHSVKDVLVPVDGGLNPSGIPLPPLSKNFAEWAVRNGCDPERVLFIDEPLYQAYSWTNCDGDAQINYYLTLDGGHSWPGGTNTTVDPPSAAFDNNDLIWEFVRKYTR